MRRRGVVHAVSRALVTCVVSAVIAACAAPAPRPSAPAPPPDDPIAMLPSGIELVAEVDVRQLRGWPTWHRITRMRDEIAGTTAARLDLEELAIDPLADLDDLALGATAVGTETVELTVIARGRFAPERLRERLAAGGSIDDIEYHGERLWLRRGTGDGIALVGPRTLVSGRGSEVRRAVDVRRGNEVSWLGTPSSRTLLAALDRAPGAKVGRPALRAALVVTPAVRERAALQGIGRTVTPLDWISLAIAVGDGADLGIVAGTRDARTAAAWIADARAGLDTLKAQPALRLLRLSPFVDDIKFGQKGAEAHVAFRLADRRLAQFLDRVAALARVAARKRDPDGAGDDAPGAQP